MQVSESDYQSSLIFINLLCTCLSNFYCLTSFEIDTIAVVLIVTCVLMGPICAYIHKYNTSEDSHQYVVLIFIIQIHICIINNAYMYFMQKNHFCFFISIVNTLSTVLCLIIIISLRALSVGRHKYYNYV